MNSAEAFAVVVREGTADDGMVIEMRAGIDPGQQRVRRLCDALAILVDETASDSTLDRNLANALYGLSFHMSETLNHCQSCDWIPDYTVALSRIESIFEGATNESCRTKR